MPYSYQRNRPLKCAAFESGDLGFLRHDGVEFDRVLVPRDARTQEEAALHPALFQGGERRVAVGEIAARHPFPEPGILRAPPRTTSTPHQSAPVEDVRLVVGGARVDAEQEFAGLRLRQRHCVGHGQEGLSADAVSGFRAAPTEDVNPVRQAFRVDVERQVSPRLRGGRWPGRRGSTRDAPGRSAGKR